MLMSKTAVDCCSDTNHSRLHKLSKLVQLPDFVEKAATIAGNDVAGLPLAVFADPENRKFPLNTKAATWLAQAYFSHDRHLYTTQQAADVQDKITKAADYWSISGFVKKARQTVEKSLTSTPPELTDDDYALVVNYEGEAKRMLPVHSAENVKSAAATLWNQRSKCPYEWRLVASRKILRKAAEFGVQLDGDLSSYLTKAAAMGSSFPSVAAEKLGYRVLMIPDSHKNVKVAVAKLVKAISLKPNLPSSGELIKLASIVDKIDTEEGLRRYYDEGSLETPEEILFELTREKAASIRESFLMLTTGTVVPFEALQNAPLAKIAEALGFLDRVQDDGSLDVNVNKFVKLASTLPRNDALMLERLFRAADIAIKEPTAADVM